MPPLITFGQNNFATEAQLSAVIVATLGAGRSFSLTYNADLGTLFEVDLPDASQPETDAVRAALINAFPAETSGFRSEPHSLLCMLDGAPQAWNAMPAALTEFRGTNAFRAGCSMLKVEQVRLVANVLTPGVAGSLLAVQWSAGAAFAFFDVAGQGPQVSIAVAGFRVSPWTNVPVGARLDGVAIRVVGINGNGVVSPAFGQVLVEGK